MEHALGPLYAELQYNANGRLHKSVVCLPWTGQLMPVIGVDPTLVTKAGDEVAASVALTALAVSMKDVFHTGQGFTAFDVKWASESGNEPVWIFGGAILGAAGTNTAASVDSSQLTLTMRTSKGNGMRLVVMESVFAYDQSMTGSAISSNGVLLPWAEYLMGGSCAIVGRDGGYPIALRRLLTKQNDVYRRGRLG